MILDFKSYSWRMVLWSWLLI